MDEKRWLAERFESHRTHLRGVAYRMLGSLSEAEDAVQEAWIRLHSSDASAIENLGGWLTTVVGRVCLDVLRSRKARREVPLENYAPQLEKSGGGGTDPEHELLLADSVGLALLVVLEALSPAERVAFVLHDVFAVPFPEIAAILERSEAAVRQMASRARRRVHGTPTVPDSDLDRRRELVDAFLAASKAGNFNGLLSMLDPDVVLRADPEAAAAGTPAELRGAVEIARQINGRAVHAQSGLVDGTVGVVVAPRGRLLLVMKLAFRGGKISGIEVIANPARLRQVEVGVLGG